MSPRRWKCVAPRRRRHLPGAGGGAARAAQGAGDPLAHSQRRARIENPTMVEGLAAEPIGRLQQSRGRGQEARRHASDGRCKQGVLALSLVKMRPVAALAWGSTPWRKIATHAFAQSAWDASLKPNYPTVCNGQNAALDARDIFSCPANTPSRTTAISASWPDYIDAGKDHRRPNASSIIPARATRSAKSMIWRQRPWTDGAGAVNAASPSPWPQPKKFA